MKGQPGFFDLAERHDKLTRMRDPLMLLKKEIDREAFRSDLSRLHDKERKSAAGAKPWDVVRMFKVLILQPNQRLADVVYRLRRTQSSPDRCAESVQQSPINNPRAC